MPENLTQRILKTIRHYEMFSPGDTALVAVSGGPDSVFMLHVLKGLERKLRIKKLVVCHLDHGLRGKDSRADALFIKSLSRDMGLECAHRTMRLKRRKKRGISTEELAREARYGFFLAAARAYGANAIATGHTIDDQAETVLMRLIKGSSLKGVAGIPPVREEGGIRIVRPLIEIEKSDIRKHLDANGIRYRIDATNLEPVYFRNVVRSEAIPFLEKYNPRLKRALFNLAEHLREDYEFIKAEKGKAGKILKTKGPDIVRIDLKDIVVQPRALQKEILRDALEKVGGEVKKLSFRHWKEMENFIRMKRRGSSLDLPGGIRLGRDESALEMRRL